ncbi:hypothetical protein GXW74_18145 [Roseomonas eburnea]|uniref:Uncharacterized protein n=1 Tax=Neoroseomonas eburnea TaxID=1346889 RepID=A0A9X9XFD3_9PROT|nr:hypothetical protein [Neoroseomonas eburnea]MBR0682419.1 hypothetical protein [Neoroseomonas eburnea]
MSRPPGLPPMPRRPAAALLLVAAMLVVLWWSVPAAFAALRLSGWHVETVIVVFGAHALFLGAFGWIAWLFWAGRRPGDGG